MMKQLLLSIIRDKHTTPLAYRDATEKLGFCLAMETSELLEKVGMDVETPLAACTGVHLKNEVVLVPVLRSGIALLGPFMRYFPTSKVGFIGMRRDEHTAQPHMYYKNIPTVDPTDDVVILDPMIATGGSGMAAINALKEAGVKENKMIFVGVIAAPEGMAEIRKEAPQVRYIIAHMDDKLNTQKFILPGLGDFGDRYFRT